MSSLASNDGVGCQDDRPSAPAEEAQFGDVGLIVGIGRGRTAALAEVYSRYGGALYDVVTRICGPELAEEVVRAVLLALWREPGRFDPDRTTLRAHLLHQAHASAVDAVRAGVPGVGPVPAAPRSARVRWTLDLAALAARAGAHAWSLLSGLPDDQRDAVALAYSCGYSCRDLGELLDEPEATVRARIRSGLTGLGHRVGRPQR
ncbi:MAG: hypothetical protein M3066_19365 [Actinomycetota bacterium]|nr:hypothetical protein [Actinomycetota bacterium]